MKAVVIAHGSLSRDEILKSECRYADTIICADGGAEYAYRCGIIPNYLIGDFDSIDINIFEYFEDQKTEIIRFSREKDYTDTEICVKKALELNCDEICILAGIGGRMDHSLGNIGLLHIISDRGSRGYIASEDCNIYLCNSDSDLSIKGNIGDVVSILPFKDDVHGVTLKGLKYPLNDAYIEFGLPIGLSNEMLENECMISIKSGELLVIKNNNIF